MSAKNHGGEYYEELEGLTIKSFSLLKCVTHMVCLPVLDKSTEVQVFAFAR